MSEGSCYKPTGHLIRITCLIYQLLQRSLTSCLCDQLIFKKSFKWHFLVVLYRPFLNLVSELWQTTHCSNRLIICVPTLYINNYWNNDIVFYLFISDFIALARKDDMLKKVPTINDFYIVRLCSNTQISSVLSLSQSTSNTFLPFIYIGNLNRRPFNILPSFCSSS